MNFKNKYDGIDEYAVRLIKHKAGKLIKQFGFTESDRQDLEQEILFDMFCHLPKFNSNCAQRNTFITHVVEHKIINIIEARKAGVRNYSLCAYSLNECLEGKNGGKVERIETINQDEYLYNMGKLLRPLEELTELTIDIKEVIAGLPPKYRNLCECLKEEKVAEISRNMNISRETIYKYIREIRELFEIIGLKNYF